MSGNLLGQPAQADNVLEQSADIGVVHDFGGRSALEVLGDRGSENHLQDQFFSQGFLISSA